MKISTLLSSITAVLLVSGVAIAEPKTFKEVDTNSDGMLDAAEFAISGVEKTLKSLDSDKNGNLNEDEYSVVLEEECE